jgi:RNA polymerase sigma factor (sigma-70 family)
MFVITQTEFDSLLAWLGPDREFAGRKYETIRGGLVRMFVSKGFNDAEDLADETINRVMLRLPDIREVYRGEPARYFHGVARNIVRESLRRKEIAMEVKAVQAELPPLDFREEHDCLGHCLQLLSNSKRDLILSYYLYDGHDKVEHHKQMAGELNITKGAYRSRAHQIRLSLEKCMRECPLRQKNLCPHKR